MLLEMDPSERGISTGLIANAQESKRGWIFTNLLIENRDYSFYGRDLLSIKEFNRRRWNYIFGLAEEMREMVKEKDSCDLLRGKVLANLFYEPSTRTSSSFSAAMQRLGGSVIPINEVRYSSVTKGESLADTVRTLGCYADVIVLRHPEVGSAQIAADYASKPIINAGDGATGEHPTQALLDLFTIQQEMGKIDNLKVVMVGDLLSGRTVHSLARLLAQYKVSLVFVSPEQLNVPDALFNELRAKGVPMAACTDIKEVIECADVLYVTQVRPECFKNETLYEEAMNCYVITPALLKRAKKQMIIMHPLPRGSEISCDVDKDLRAAYFRQAENGMYIRMALLAAILTTP